MRLEKWNGKDALCRSLLEEGLRTLMNRMLTKDSILFATSCSTAILLPKLSILLTPSKTRHPKVLAVRGEFEKTELGVVRMNVALLCYQDEVDTPTVLVRGELLDLMELLPQKVETYWDMVKVLDYIKERCVYALSKGLTYAIRHDEKMFVRVFQRREDSDSVSFSSRRIVRAPKPKWRIYSQRWPGTVQKRLIPSDLSSIECLTPYVKKTFEMMIPEILSSETLNPSHRPTHERSKIRKRLKELSDILFQPDGSLTLCRTIDGCSDYTNGRSSWRYIRLRFALRIAAPEPGSEPHILYENQWTGRSIPTSEEEQTELIEELTEAVLKRLPNLINLSFIRPEFLDKEASIEERIRANERITGILNYSPVDKGFVLNPSI